MEERARASCCYKCALLAVWSLPLPAAPPRVDHIETSGNCNTVHGSRIHLELSSSGLPAMGISSMPEPRDSLLAYLLYNTVVSIAALAGLVRAALVFLDLQAALPAGEGADGGDRVAASGPGLAERFRSSFRQARFGRAAAAAWRGAADDDDDCSVCLAGFELEAVVDRLPCGHLFHRACLETWLRYDRATCPLCRARLLPAADEPPTPVLRFAEFE